MSAAVCVSCFLWDQVKNMKGENSDFGSRNNICGGNVARLRKSMAGKPSQGTLAAWMQLKGIRANKNTIQRIEAGTRAVKDIELDALAQIFHVSADELLHGLQNDR